MILDILPALKSEALRLIQRNPLSTISKPIPFIQCGFDRRQTDETRIRSNLIVERNDIQFRMRTRIDGRFSREHAPLRLLRHLPRRKRRGLSMVGPNQRDNFLPVFSRSPPATYPYRASQRPSRTCRGHRSRFQGAGDCYPVSAKNSRVVRPRTIATVTVFGSFALPRCAVVAQPTKSASATVLSPFSNKSSCAPRGPKPAGFSSCVVKLKRFPSGLKAGIPSLFKDG
jgi:hypothetical protein